MVQGFHRSGKTGKGVKNSPCREKSGNLKTLLKSGNFVKLCHKDTKICKAVETLGELLLFERLLVVSCCGTPLLISYHLKYIIYENILG